MNKDRIFSIKNILFSCLIPILAQKFIQIVIIMKSIVLVGGSGPRLYLIKNLYGQYLFKVVEEIRATGKANLD